MGYALVASEYAKWAGGQPYFKALYVHNNVCLLFPYLKRCLLDFSKSARKFLPRKLRTESIQSILGKFGVYSMIAVRDHAR